MMKIKENSFGSSPHLSRTFLPSFFTTTTSSLRGIKSANLPLCSVPRLVFCCTSRQFHPLHLTVYIRLFPNRQRKVKKKSKSLQQYRSLSLSILEKTPTKRSDEKKRRHQSPNNFRNSSYFKYFQVCASARAAACLNRALTEVFYTFAAFFYFVTFSSFQQLKTRVYLYAYISFDTRKCMKEKKNEKHEQMLQQFRLYRRIFHCNEITRNEIKGKICRLRTLKTFLITLLI